MTVSRLQMPRSALRISRGPDVSSSPARRWPGAYACGLALLVLLVPLDAVWAAQLLLIPLLFIVPGVILLRALRIPGNVIVSFPLYVPYASVVVLPGSNGSSEVYHR